MIGYPGVLAVRQWTPGFWIGTLSLSKNKEGLRCSIAALYLLALGHGDALWRQWRIGVTRLPSSIQSLAFHTPNMQRFVDDMIPRNLNAVNTIYWKNFKPLYYREPSLHVASKTLVTNQTYLNVS